MARLNAIAQDELPSIEETRERAAEHKDFPALQELVSQFPDEQSIFASWKSLETYAKLQSMLSRTDLIDSITNLRAQGRSDLAKWLEVLAFNSKSRVSTSAIEEFIHTPDEFMSREDDHASETLHEATKPSNYTEVPHLDLTAEQLRDALTNGSLDRLQVHTPMTVQYVIGAKPVGEELKIALGTNGDGKAKRVGRLFKETKDLLAPANLTPLDVINGATLPPQMESQLQDLIYRKDIGINEPSERYRLTASVHRKSDPLSAIAGDETDCCMSFGTGKNNTYMLNPNNSVFTVRATKADGSSNIITQSVLTKDMNVKAPTDQFMEALEGGPQVAVHQLIPDEVLQAQKAYLAGDNIEIKSNHANKLAVIEAIYKDFFSRYLKANAAHENLHDDQILLGLSHSDALRSVDREANTFVPQAPPGYSDKAGDAVGVLPVKQGEQKNIRLIEEEQQPISDRVTSSTAPGVTPLTFESTLPASFIQSKTSEDNPWGRQGLFNIQNTLIAKDINNIAKGRPNLSLKYVDESGRMKGYMVAYEGVSEVNGEPTPSIVISDIATLGDSSGARTFASQLNAGKMIQAFGDLYRKHYVDQGRVLPIVVSTRDGVGAGFVANKLEKIDKRAGINFKPTATDAFERDYDYVQDIALMPSSTAPSR
ncbi:MAG TPA: hypothetical protein V6C76_13275 [Drouetiella sp.]